MNNAHSTAPGNAPVFLSEMDRLRPVRIWLYILALMVIFMVAVGGMTRLTDSGLSITQWKPLSGALPPLSLADWAVEFENYQQIPEYKLQNHWMSLPEFKYIFWWEWGHRFLGRLIGLAFAIPFAVFLVQRRLSWRLAPALAVLFVMGGFQGFLGWWMVSSGLNERTDVSQYRLAAHLGAAALLFAALIFVARRITPLKKEVEAGWGWRWAIVGLGGLIFCQLLMGAFVAGPDAGYGYDSWPRMEGALFPAGLTPFAPWWKNLFDVPLTAQFTHRVLAYFILAVVGILYWWRKKHGMAGIHGWMKVIAMMTCLQVLLGIATLVLVVPIPLALGHQALAFMLMGCCAAYAADMVGMRYNNTA